MADQNQSSYRSIVKGTAIFGGVQVFNILINLLRGKFIAMLLGPTGMGISSLYTSTTSTITQFTSFGLNLSAVREISAANETGDLEKLSRVARVFRRLVLFTGILAALIAIIGAPWLSNATFGDNNHVWGFITLSIMLFFTANTAAETAMLQGTRRLKYLAKSSLTGAIAGLIVGIPFYYFWGVDGIVPAMIVLAVVTFSVNRYFANKIELTHQKISTWETFKEGKQMLSLGIVMVAASLIGSCALYIINVYIRRTGSVDDVGLYQAATSITNQYVGLVFAAMAVDYFPRLAAVSNDRTKVQETVTHQMEITMLMVVPLLIAIMVTAPLLIRILLAKEFLPVIPIVRWLALGLFFKAFSYPIGYISFAKGDKRFFFWFEGVLGTSMNLIFSLAGYSLWGLNGLGIAFTVALILYTIFLLIASNMRFGFTINTRLLKIFIPLFIALIMSFAVFQINQGFFWGYIITSFILVSVSIYSYKELDKRIGIRELFLSRVKRKISHE